MSGLPPSDPQGPQAEAWRYLRGGPVVVFRWANQDGWPVEYVTPNVLEMFGHSAEDFLSGKVPYASVVHPDELARVGQEVMDAQEQGLENFEQSYHFLRADGAVRHLYDYTVVHRDEHGHATHFEGYVLDDTARQSAEQALREEEEDSTRLVGVAETLASDIDYQELCSHALDAIRDYADMCRASLFLQDAEDRCILRRMGCVTPSPELETKVLYDIRDNPWYRRALNNNDLEVCVDVLADPECSGGDFDRADLRSLVVIPMRLAAGGAAYLALGNPASAQPIEDSLRFRRFLRRLGVLLSTAMDRVWTVHQRQAMERQLHHAQRMEAVGLLAGGVAHNFNNTLTVILGYTSMLLSEDGVREDDKAKLRAVMNAGEGSAAAVRQLLEFSRKQKTHEPRLVAVKKVMEGQDLMLRPLIGEGMELEIDLGSDLGALFLEPGELEMVLMNLAINAKDATNAEGSLAISVRHRLAKEEGHQDVVRFEISDNGSGMSEEVRLRLFEPFFTTKEEGHGTGLGLAAVYGVVQRAGGTIEVDSSPGHGTTFRLQLPWFPWETEEDAVPAAEPHFDGTGQVVLLVEDQESVRALAEQTLKLVGFTVLVAEDGEAACSYADDPTQTIDLLLSDVVMPRMDGLELCRRFSMRRPETPILLMSGFVDRVFPGAGPEAQGIPFLRKPFTGTQLLEAASMALAKV
ncbi:MAG: ATP-binding protein [Planctomycetota bacterium]